VGRLLGGVALVGLVGGERGDGGGGGKEGVLVEQGMRLIIRSGNSPISMTLRKEISLEI
jgi:hypothetical protein